MTGVQTCALPILNEEIFRTTIGFANKHYAEAEPRGEYVLIVEGFLGVKKNEERDSLLSLTPEEHVQKYINDGMSKMDAIKAAAKDRSMNKSELYKIINCD